jgi:sialidase-1
MHAPLSWVGFSAVLVSGCSGLAPAPLAMTAAGKPAEGDLAPFLRPAAFSIHRVFESERFPNIVVGVDGEVLAFWGNRRVQVRRSEDGGLSWGSPITVADPGFHGGGATVDETTGDVLAFVEATHPPAPITVYRSVDGGRSWCVDAAVVRPDAWGHAPSMHMNEGGITLRRGSHAGRLIRPSRYYAGGNRREEWPNHYTNAVFSDDHGKTWNTGAPFPEKGTGEAALVELADGRLYCNSRVHWPQARNPTRRRCAWSSDAGATWEGWQIVADLPDGRQDRAYGCMGGLTRLPVEGRDVLIFSNLDTSRKIRERITVWGSFDGGKTWPVKRLVYDGPSGYSSLAAGRPQTPSEGWIYLHFEGGPKSGSHVARFNLSWLLEGVGRQGI